MKNYSNTLRCIFTEHTGKVSDKWSIYLDEYNRLFEPIRDQPVRLLEIGIQNGGSLEIWNKFFPNAEMLVGCDIDPLCAQLQFDDPKIAVVVANANSDEAEQDILKASASFDIIIDDGSHHSGDIVRSFSRYFSHLNEGGLYIAEDLHCSYWQNCEGGIFHPYSSIAFFKRLADIVNHEHWGNDMKRCDLMNGFNSQYVAQSDELVLSHIHSIEFINSMCVIRKSPVDDNIIGTRLVVGTLAPVCSDIMPFHGTGNLLPSQDENIWSRIQPSVEEELLARTQEVESLNQTVTVREAEITTLNQTIVAREQETLAQLTFARQQHETIVLELAEQKRNSSLQHQETQRQLELQIVDLGRLHAELEASVSLDRHANEDALIFR